MSPGSVVPILALALSLSGCGGGGTSKSTAPRPLVDREAIAAALPSGVTLESAVEPGPFVSPEMKTVEEALASLQAHVQDGKIIDGGLGHEIQFDTGAEPRSVKPSASTRGGGSQGVRALVIKIKR